MSHLGNEVAGGRPVGSLRDAPGRAAGGTTPWRTGSLTQNPRTILSPDGVQRMNTALSIETELLDGDILAVVLGGSLNSTTTDQFNLAIQNHLDQGRTKIIIDCRYVDYISSRGLGSLAALRAKLRKKGGEVKLAAVRGVAADAIRLVGLDKLLNIYGDTEFARQSFYPATP